MKRFRFLLVCAATLALALSIDAQDIEIVLAGGRVMDPETGLDAVRSVGIADGKIVAITEEPLTGARTNLRRICAASSLSTSCPLKAMPPIAPGNS